MASNLTALSSPFVPGPDRYPVAAGAQIDAGDADSVNHLVVSYNQLKHSHDCLVAERNSAAWRQDYNTTLAALQVSTAERATARERIAQLEREVSQLKESAGRSSSECEGESACQSCVYHLKKALSISRSAEDAANALVDSMSLERMQAWNELNEFLNEEAHRDIIETVLSKRAAAADHAKDGEGEESEVNPDRQSNESDEESDDESVTFITDSYDERRNPTTVKEKERIAATAEKSKLEETEKTRQHEGEEKASELKEEEEQVRNQAEDEAAQRVRESEKRRQKKKDKSYKKRSKRAKTPESQGNTTDGQTLDNVVDANPKPKIREGFQNYVPKGPVVDDSKSEDKSDDKGENSKNTADMTGVKKTGSTTTEKTHDKKPKPKHSILPPKTSSARQASTQPANNDLEKQKRIQAATQRMVDKATSEMVMKGITPAPSPKDPKSKETTETTPPISLPENQDTPTPSRKPRTGGGFVGASLRGAGIGIKKGGEGERRKKGGK